MNCETNLTIIAKISAEKEEENWEFRSFLKTYDGPEEEIDRIVHRLYRGISSEVDCKQCANCCKKLHPVLNQKDIITFSRGLSQYINEFKARYFNNGEVPGEYRLKALPCPFLKDNLCINYERRPLDCRSFPHLHKKNFTRRLNQVLDNYAICPIVFNVFEFLKDEIWHVRG
jgi:Fe-S-cluster containining protein